MNLPFFIARRYLFARKSHNVINIISAISMAGMAVGTAALVIILSVYNGFNDLVEHSFSEVDPDILVTPARGKVFVPDSTTFSALYDDPSVLSISEIMEDNIFLSYDGGQSVCRARGVDAVYEDETLLHNHLLEGSFTLHNGTLPMAAVSVGLAQNLGINPRFVLPLEIHYPSRTGNISITNPAASVHSKNLRPSCIFSVNSDMDADMIIIPIETMRELMQYESEVSAIEIRLTPGTSTKSIIKAIQKSLGDGYKVSDRYHQKESIYKMMRYEKAAIFLILIFVIIIIASNIFGSLTMLIIEKEGDIATLRSMGATSGLIKRIFILEGWLISLTGMAAGLVIGIIFVLLQQHFGFISMPSGFMVNAYPVILRPADLILAAAGVSAVGYIIARMTSSFDSRE
ncbi:MAG: ABC transporter permease [Bacteroidales bacterium]|nr:ABC transporter permease [Bacteroidales bacterium]